MWTEDAKDWTKVKNIQQLFRLVADREELSMVIPNVRGPLMARGKEEIISSYYRIEFQLSSQFTISSVLYISHDPTMTF